MVAARYSALLLLVFAALFPSLLLAAGFPTQSIWLSKEHVIAGDPIIIFTALSNETEKPIKGTLVFTVDAAKVGSKAFEVDAHTSKIESTEWRAQAGPHVISASIEGAALENNTTGALAITIADPPLPSQAAQTAAAVSGMFGTIVASSTPVITGAAQAVYGATEYLRQQGVAYFENQLAKNTDKSSGDSVGTNSADNVRAAILGTSTKGSDFTAQAAGAATSSWWKNIVLLFDRAALTVLRSAAFFYPFLALIFFALFYLLARRVRRNPSP